MSISTIGMLRTMSLKQPAQKTSGVSSEEKKKSVKQSPTQSKMANLGSQNTVAENPLAEIAAPNPTPPTPAPKPMAKPQTEMQNLLEMCISPGKGAKIQLNSKT